MESFEERQADRIERHLDDVRSDDLSGSPHPAVRTGCDFSDVVQLGFPLSEFTRYAMAETEALPVPSNTSARAPKVDDARSERLLRLRPCAWPSTSTTPPSGCIDRLTNVDRPFATEIRRAYATTSFSNVMTSNER